MLLVPDENRDHQIPSVALSRTQSHHPVAEGTQSHSMPIKRQSELIRIAYLTTNWSRRKRQSACNEGGNQSSLGPRT